MFLKNLQLAFRNLSRDKFYTLINIAGLSIGIAAALLLFIWVNNEYAYDSFHPNEDRLYRINESSTFGGERTVGPKTALPLAEAARVAVPEIQHISTVAEAWSAVFKVDNFLLDSEDTKLVSPSFLKMFDFTFLKGDATTALDHPNSIILTKSFAYQLFGSTEVMGQSVNLNETLDLLVTGIIEDFPVNSHLKIESLIPVKGNLEQLINPGSLQWGSNNFSTYTLLRPEVDVAKVEKKLTAVIPESRQENEAEASWYKLQLIKDIYLGDNEGNVASIGDVKTIRLISIIGLLILLIACINYVNLTTARAAQRAKAIGVQKIIGASKKHLFSQHLVEAALVVISAGILAVALANFNLPAFENLVGTKMPIQSVLSAQTFPILGLTILSAILLSGLQPALQLAAFQPINALKGNQFNYRKGKIDLRKILVIGQFTCSAALVICTLIMMQQLDFIQQSKLGYEKEHIFSFWQDRDQAQLIKDDLLKQPGIEEVTLSNRDLVNVNSRYGGFTYEGMPEGASPSIFNIAADSEFIDFFGLTLKEGRWFREDGKDTKSYIINQAAVDAFQLENPIGKWIDFWGRRGTIVGVLDNFHFRSFHHTIEPIIFEQNPNWYYKSYIKTTGTNAAAAIAAAETIYKKHQPNSVFKYEFLEEKFDDLYKKESRMSQLFTVFALLTIFISCLGIFGLATYTAERRSKEIGIRKVLGASILNIINLLSLDFLKLVFFSLIIAIPIAWYFMTDWLNDFAFGIKIGWGVFALTAFLTIFIAYVTIGFQSVRAALVNPADTLKSE